MNFALSPELLAIQDLVRRFVSRELAPLEQAIDEADDVDPTVMSGLRQKAVEIGLYGFNLPTELGGGGVGPLGEAVIGEETGRTSMPLAEAVGRLPRSLTFATEAQRPWLVDPAVAGLRTVCVALTEPDAGSDLGGLRTRGVLEHGKWRLNGSKTFISNAETSDHILVLAVTDPGAPLRRRFTVFAVDRNDPGLHITHRFRKMGWRGYHISSFSLDDCVLDEDRVLGEVGGGFRTMMASINRTRLYIAARCVGAARELLRLAVEHANVRTTFGRTLSSHQAIQFILADIDVELEAARMLTFKAAWEVEQGLPSARIAVSRAKLYASEMAGRVADNVLQIFGGAGYMADIPVERFYRDLRGYRIGEGSSEMQRVQIARHVLARG
jgi:alkylation response protein AidB-like acyl-CoA dehydrogenase